MKLFKKILIANRGEIAVRIIRSAKKLDIKTVCIYSTADEDALHPALADESYCIGGVDLSDSYLNIDKIIQLAKKTCCDAIHPGYGFLSESPLLVAACEKAGIVFIGPSTNSIKVMGNKIEARNFARSIDIPMTEGIEGSPDQLRKAAEHIAFPLLVKAAAGGGGKGMRIVHDQKELDEAIESTAREAKSYFGDETIYIEKFIENPRHIEIQVLGDNFGNTVHLFERECSIQRRYQKIIEEAPSVTLTEDVRKKMGAAAVRIASQIGYNSVGTVEFLVDKNLEFYFLEMNTRIQVEHPVTEMTTGIDLVEEQILVAAGNKLRFVQDNLGQAGHSIECRIYAENPAKNYMPSPGKMYLYKEPVSFDVRIDTGVTADTEIKSFFDPMISKLIVWGNGREEARILMISALKEYIIQGIETNIPYLIKVLQHKAFSTNAISTKFCENYTIEIIDQIQCEYTSIPIAKPVIAYLLYSLNIRRDKWIDREEYNVWDQIGYWRNYMTVSILMQDKAYPIDIISQNESVYELSFENEKFTVEIMDMAIDQIVFRLKDELVKAYISEDEYYNAYVTCNGHTFTMRRTDLLSSEYSLSDDAAASQTGNSISSPMPGKIIKINVIAGQEVKKGEVLLIVEAMKMENSLASPRNVVIEKINVSIGDMVDGSVPLVVFKV